MSVTLLLKKKKQKGSRMNQPYRQRTPHRDPKPGQTTGRATVRAQAQPSYPQITCQYTSIHLTSCHSLVPQGRTFLL